MTMDGMIQGLTFENGRADYRNRWIRTPKFVQGSVSTDYRVLNRGLPGG